MPIKVYQQEILDGIENIVRSQASIAYVSQAKPLNVIDEKIKDKINRVLAANSSHSDLFYLDTILATTCCNLNKDIFTKAEMWAARHTAEDKPFNLRHVQDDIIGHITANIVIDDEFKIVPDNASLNDVPDKFHILTSAVIYKFYQDDERRDAIAKIIDEICEGKWCVSMECIFSDFDYGLIAPDGEQRVIARTEESSFLTKYMRQYGGKGVYNGYSLGRVLKGINFIGKGLVEDPANPDSKIFVNATSFNYAAAGLGYIMSSKSQDQTGESDMNLEELKAALAEAQKEIKELKSQVSEANIKQYTDKITGLEAKLADAIKANEDAAAASADKAKEAKEALDNLTEAKVAAESQVSEYKQKAEDAIAQINQLNKDKRTQDRVAAAVAKNAGADEAKAFADKHADKSDEDFEEVLSYASYKWAGSKAETTTASTVLENATKTETEVVVVATEDNKFSDIQDFIRAAYKKEVK